MALEKDNVFVKRTETFYWTNAYFELLCLTCLSKNFSLVQRHWVNVERMSLPSFDSSTPAQQSPIAHIYALPILQDPPPPLPCWLQHSRVASSPNPHSHWLNDLKKINCHTVLVGSDPSCLKETEADWRIILTLITLSLNKWKSWRERWMQCERSQLVTDLKTKRRGGGGVGSKTEPCMKSKYGRKNLNGLTWEQLHLEGVIDLTAWHAVPNSLMHNSHRMCCR